MTTHDTCSRCGEVMRAFTMSMFNTERICVACKDDERGAPGYEAAVTAELAAYLSGDNHFPGVGLSDADRAYLARMLENRRSGTPNISTAR